jgi:hypothetical protein
MANREFSYAESRQRRRWCFGHKWVQIGTLRGALPRRSRYGRHCYRLLRPRTDGCQSIQRYGGIHANGRCHSFHDDHVRRAARPDDVEGRHMGELPSKPRNGGVQADRVDFLGWPWLNGRGSFSLSVRSASAKLLSNANQLAQERHGSRRQIGGHRTMADTWR